MNTYLKCGGGVPEDVRLFVAVLGVSLHRDIEVSLTGDTVGSVPEVVPLTRNQQRSRIRVECGDRRYLVSIVGRTVSPKELHQAVSSSWRSALARTWTSPFATKSAKHLSVPPSCFLKYLQWFEWSDEYGRVEWSPPTKVDDDLVRFGLLTESHRHGLYDLERDVVLQARIKPRAPKPRRHRGSGQAIPPMPTEEGASDQSIEEIIREAISREPDPQVVEELKSLFARAERHGLLDKALGGDLTAVAQELERLEKH